jgi:hypothetical protein
MSATGPLRIVLVPDHDPVPVTSDGSVDRMRVSRVRILEIVDYHGH